jgi:hypothetical protein
MLALTMCSDPPSSGHESLKFGHETATVSGTAHRGVTSADTLRTLT